MKEYHGSKNCENWHKENIHSHTTILDGVLTPEQSVTFYRDSGYHFMRFSEHDISTDLGGQFNTETFIILPAVGSNVILYRAKDTSKRYRIHHLHGILRAQAIQDVAPLGTYGHMQYIPPMRFFEEWTDARTAQEAADMLRDHGCVTAYNHPIWGRVTEEGLIHTEGISALKTSNYNTVQESNTGYDVAYRDRMLHMGRYVNAFASDDNRDEGLFGDSCGGWICIQVPDLNHDNTAQNSMKGDYYSSSGPEIYDWGVKDGKVWVDTSGVNHIDFVCENIISDGTAALSEYFKDTPNHSEYTLKGHETYIRTKTMDKYGHTVWTSPIYLGW